MGGQAFNSLSSDHPIHVPRMLPTLYKQLTTECTAKLQTLFQKVVIPREAPGKLDHGDIDMLVEGLLTPEPDEKALFQQIKVLLGAELWVWHGGLHSFGMRHPIIPNAYVQVDVEICPGNGTPEGAELFEWTRFIKGDADLLQIIGLCHRPLGLMCNDRGCYIRIEEIESYNKKQSLIFLTRDPNEAMKFYGLDTKKYWEGFGSEDDLFDWVAGGRFFSWSIFNDRREKSNDRSRQTKRPMYRRFIEEYMPVHATNKQDAPWTRQEVLNEALNTFGATAEYQSKIAAHNAKTAEDALWSEINQVILAERSQLELACKGLRRWVDFEQGQPFITQRRLQEVPVWSAKVPAQERGELLKWVEDHWEEVRLLEKHYAHAVKGKVAAVPKTIV